MAKKQPTFNFFIKDKAGNPVNIKTLSEEDQREVGVWAYQTLVKGLGYEPVATHHKEEKV
ncbi:MAG: hypothetical protein ACI4AD_04815 [Roseburia sp.]